MPNDLEALISGGSSLGDEGPGTSLSDLVKGAAVGLHDDPIIGGLMNVLADGQLNTDPQFIEQFRQEIEGKTPAEVSRVIGEFAPLLFGGAAVFNAGRKVGTKVAHAAAARMARKLSGDELKDLAQEQVARRFLLDPALGKRTKASLAKQAVQLDPALDPGAFTAGIDPLIEGLPGVTRIAQSIGGELAIGGAIFAHERANGREVGEAAQSAAIGMAFGFAFEGALGVLAGKAGRGAFFRQAFDERQDVAATRALIQKSKEKIATLKADIKGRFPSDPMVRKMIAAGKIKDPLVTRANLLRAKRGLEALTPEEEATRLAARRARAHRTARTKIRPLAKEIRFREDQIRIKSMVPISDPHPSGPDRNILKRAAELTGIQTFMTPEGTAGRHGPTWAKLMTLILPRSHQLDFRVRTLETQIGNAAEGIRKALGMTEKKATRDGFLQMLHHWELGGPAQLANWMKNTLGRSADDIANATKIMDDMSALNWEVLQIRGATIGARPAMDPASKGLAKYWMHASDDLDENQVVKRLLKARNDDGAPLMDELTAHTRAAEAFRLNRGARAAKLRDPRGVGGVGTPRAPSIDFDRIAKGTLWEKFNKGLPVSSNPFEAQLRSLAAAERRIHFDPIFGTRGKSISNLVKIIKSEGGDEAVVETVMRHIAGNKYYPAAMRKTAIFFSGLQTTLKLPLAVFVNLTQRQNTVAAFGWKQSVLKPAIKYGKSVDRDQLGIGLGVHHEFIRALSHVGDDLGFERGMMERIADWTLRVTQFDKVERWNRMHAATAALSTIRDHIIRGEAGLLKGKTLSAARRRMRNLGMNLDDEIRQARDLGGTHSLFNSEAYQGREFAGSLQGASLTQFLPGRTNRPIFWSHPLGRVLFQFKTFALSQSRFLRNVVGTEAAQGNLAPIGALLALAPVQGEAVSGIRESWIKDKPRNVNGVERLLDDFLHVGGVGLISDAMGAAVYGNLESVLLGPTGGEMVQMIEIIAKAIAGKGEIGDLPGMFANDPAAQAAKFLLRGAEGAAGGVLWSADRVQGYLDGVSGGLGESQAVDIDELLRR